MNKFCLLAMFLLLNCFVTLAQDVIVKKNGSVIKAKVTEVGISQVFYKMGSDADAALFVVRKSELTRIEFADGQVVVLDDRDRSQGKRAVKADQSSFGRNMINLSPFKALDSGPGFGLNYEIIVDKKGYFGVTLPLSMTFPDTYDYVFDNNMSNTYMFYVAPGLKIYPFGQRRVTYAVGPNLFTGIGYRQKYINQYDPQTGIYYSDEGKAKNFRFGLIVNNYVNFQITPNFQLGLSGGLGSCYVDDETFLNRTTHMRGMRITGEFNFSLGFRF